MVRFAAALVVLAVLVVASLAWGAEGPPQKKGADRIGRGSVTTLAIRDNTIRLRDFSGPVRRLVRKRGPADEDDGYGDESGFDGLDGEDGQDGDDGVAAYEVVTKETAAEVADEAAKSLEVECPPGKVVTGGGAVPTGFPEGVQVAVTLTGAQDDSTGWRASGLRITGDDPWTLEVQAICAAVDP